MYWYILNGYYIGKKYKICLLSVSGRADKKTTRKTRTRDGFIVLGFKKFKDKLHVACRYIRHMEPTHWQVNQDMLKCTYDYLTELKQRTFISISHWLYFLNLVYFAIIRNYMFVFWTFVCWDLTLDLYTITLYSSLIACHHIVTFYNNMLLLCVISKIAPCVVF